MSILEDELQPVPMLSSIPARLHEAPDGLRRPRLDGARREASPARLDLDLGQVDLRTFADGEVYCRYKESIRGADVFLVQSTAANAAQGMTPNDSLMELLAMIDAAKGASAHRIIAVMPWYGYSRQDKKSAPREPISARVVAQCLEAVGVDRVLTMDLHSGQVQGFFSKPVDHMTAMPMLTQYFIDQAWDDELVIVSPDAGPREGRAQLRPQGRRPLGGDGEGAPRAQRRDQTGYVVGDVEGKTAVLVDDMIDTAGTLCLRGEDRARRGRGEGDRLRDPRRLLRPGLRAPRLRELPDRAHRRHRHDPAAPRRSRTTSTPLSAAQTLADSIRRIFADDSVSEIFAGENQLF